MNRGNRTKSYAAAIAAFGLVALASPHAMAASATSPANATIVQAISLSNTLSLEFGDIAAGTVASVVRVDTAGLRTLQSGDATLVSGGTVRAASFDATGTNNAGYDITLPASLIISDGGGNNMTVDTFTHSAGATPNLGAGGADTFTVGADLQVGAAQVANTYTGTFTVTVNYN